MRLFRLLAGATVILFALWIITGEQITGVSSDAVVNARLSTMRSPIAGTLDMPMRAFGSGVEQGEALATISDPLADTIRLNDLRMERAFSVAEIERLTSLLGTMDSDRSGLQLRRDEYQSARMAEINARIARAQERVALLGAVATNQSVDQISADNTALSLALENLETLQIARVAMQAGVFLGDGYNDTPVSGYRLMERDASFNALDAALTETRSRLAALDQRIAEETARVALLSEATLMAPSSGILWEVLAGDQEVVQRGQDIIKLMNCDSALVTLSVPDNIYNRLRVGQTAKFRLDGTDALYDGTITRIAGSGAETIYRNLAVAPSIKHLERYDIALLVPELRENTDLRCVVGQTGRVFFDTRPLDWLRGILN